MSERITSLEKPILPMLPAVPARTADHHLELNPGATVLQLFRKAWAWTNKAKAIAPKEIEDAGIAMKYAKV